MSELKENTEFAYTLSSRKLMVQQAIRSIKTLKNYVEPEKINVFYTPPYDEHDEKELEKLGVNLIKEENETEGFSIGSVEEKGHYGEKAKLCGLEAENVVFLDCDTVVLEDIWKVIEGDFDFKARPGSESQETEEWRKMFEKRDEEYMGWMPNAGLLILKNNTHKEIGEKWLEYINSQIEYQVSDINHHEQYALALTISDYNLEKMTEDEYVMEWADKPNASGTVHHYITPNRQTFLEHLITSANRNLPFDIGKYFEFS